MEVDKPEKEEETKLTEEEKKYVKVYPIYIDKGVKYAKGRKMIQNYAQKIQMLQLQKEYVLNYQDLNVNQNLKVIQRIGRKKEELLYK